MVSSTLCPAMHILDSQNVYGRAEGIADHYWPWAVFFFIYPPLKLTTNGLFISKHTQNPRTQLDTFYLPIRKKKQKVCAGYIKTVINGFPRANLPRA